MHANARCTQASRAEGDDDIIYCRNMTIAHAISFMRLIILGRVVILEELEDVHLAVVGEHRHVTQQIPP